jgi:hypothetical protein
METAPFVYVPCRTRDTVEGETESFFATSLTFTGGIADS